MNNIDSDKIYVIDLLGSFVFSNFVNKHIFDNQSKSFDEVICDFLAEASTRNDDRRYIEKIRNNFQSTDIKDRYFLTQSYIKLFLIGLAYKFNRSDYDNYSALVDDIMTIDFPRFLKTSKNFCYLQFQFYLDILFSNKNYNNIDELRKMVRNWHDIFSNEDKLSNLEDVCSGFKKIETMIWKLSITSLVNEINNDSVIALSNSIINGDFDLKLIDNIKILLLGDRYSYFINKINEVETNPNIKNFYISYLGGLNLNMFNEMNKNTDTDSFIECMDSIFDSDSYFELTKKLMALKMASDDYDGVRKVSVFVQNFDGYSCKEVYMETEVCYPVNTMNLIVKPKRIIDRMKYLYSRIDSSMSYDFLDSVYSSCHNFNSLLPEIYEKIDRKKGAFIYKVKKKIKEQNRK